MHRRALMAITLGSALALATVPAAAGQLGKLGGALKKAQQFKDVEMTDAEEAQLGAEVSQKIRTRYGVVQNQAVHQLRHAGRHRPGAGQRQARPAVEVHRPRHRRRQRLRGARRLRPHHQGRAGQPEERSRAGRRARPRDHPRHREAHHPRHPEGQAGADGRRRDAGRQQGAHEQARRQGLRASSSRASAAARNSRATRRASCSPTPSATLRPGMNGFLHDADGAQQGHAATSKNGLFASHPEMQERHRQDDQADRVGEARRRRRPWRRATRRTSRSSRCR